MKRVFFAVAAMAAIVFASCSKDGADGVVNPNGEGAALAFTFDQPIGAYTTYAEIATANEWTINTLDAYVFQSDGTFVGKLAENTDYTKTVDNRTTTITMKQAWLDANSGKSVRFFFVANDNAANGATGAPHITANPANEAAFRLLTTNVLADADANGYYGNIETPLLFSGESTLVTIDGGKISQTVMIKRREARFDIVNSISARFTVNRVLISDAKEKGYLFGNAGAGAPAVTTFNGVSMEPVTTIPAYVSENGETISKSVFYLYPTKLDATKITIEGTLDGVAKAYTINSDMAIEANKRYKLVASTSATTDDEVVFIVLPDDYEEGSSADIVPTAEAVTLGDLTAYEGTLYASTFFYVNANAVGTVDIPVNSVNGTDVSFNTLTGVGSLTFPAPAKSTATTYAYGTVDTYTFNLPVTADADKNKPFDIEVKFTAKADASKSVTVRFVRMLASELIGTVAEPGVPNILYYDAARGLNLDGIGKPLYFKYGSLIGIDASAGQFDEFTSADVLYTPAGFGGTITDWASVPYTSSGAGIGANDAAAGTGDPCSLASKGGAGVGVGNYRLPTGNPYEGVSGDGVWGVNYNVMGRTIDGQFYPAVGNRELSAGKASAVGRHGYYWSSTRNGASAYPLHFINDGVYMIYSNTRTNGFLVRCVAN